MINRKQSAVSRRQSNRLSGDTNLSLTSINNNLNSFIQSTNFNINSITNNLNQTTQVSSNTTLNLDYQLNVTNVGSLAYTANDHEIRILALETAGPGGGGGGIDPTDPTQPILLWDNFINQSNGDESGTVSPYSFFGLPAPTSSQLLTPNELEVYEAGSETDHLGIVEVRLPVASLVGRLSLVNTSTTDSFSFDNFNVVYFIIKTTNPSDNYNIKLGLFDDISSHTEGIFFNGTKGGSWVPTVTDGTAVTGATTALANSTWYTLRIEKKSATSVGFKINNGAEVVISTNIPTGFLTCGILFENTTGTPTQDISFNIDFFSLKLKDAGTLSSGYTVVGTTNEVEVTTVGTTITVGLPSAITVDTVNTDEIFLDPTVTPPVSVTAGHLIYDSTYDTVVVGMNGSINVPIGQALFKQAHNNTGSIINKGDIVYVSGSHGTTILQVAKAQANSEATSTPTIGLAAENIAQGTDGFIITQGLLTGLNTNSYTAGQRIYLSDSVPGGWITTIPAAPLHGTFVGWIVKSAGVGAGSIYVKIQDSSQISELSDVYIPSTPSNNDVLQWDGVDARWENRSLSVAGIVPTSLTLTAGTGLTGGGDLTANRTFTVDFATSGASSSTQAVRADDSRLSDARTPTAHTHPLSDLTQSSATPNQVPQWNGSNWVPVTLSTGGSPGGSTGQVQYNNASAFAGATNVKINSDNLELVKPASEPTTAPVDSIVMYTKSIGQRDLPAFVDSSGWSTNLQTCIARNKFSMMNFNAGTATAPTSTGFIYTATSVGTGNTTAGAVSLTTTSLLGGSRRSSFLTANTSGNAAGWRTSVAQCWRGNNVGRGGFFCVWKFGIGDATLQSGATLFVGLNDAATAPDATAITNPITTVNNSMRNTVGLVLAGSSTTYTIVHRNGIAAASTIALTGFDANLTDIVEFCLYATPNDTTIHYYVKIYADSGSNLETSGDIGTSNIPANTTLFVPHCWRGRSSLAGAAVAVHCHAFSVEQPH
jgi:hypothetical protein